MNTTTHQFYVLHVNITLGLYYLGAFLIMLGHILWAFLPPERIHGRDRMIYYISRWIMAVGWVFVFGSTFIAISESTYTPPLIK